MSDYYTYKSKFSPYIMALIKEKEIKGIGKSTMFRSNMLEFDRFFLANSFSEDFITEEMLIMWHATRINDNHRNIYHKYNSWIQLCRYMSGIGVECFIPRHPKHGSQNDYIPYIYTHEEISILFTACDNLRIRKGTNRTIMFVIPALIRLLYSTGMRIGEALALNNENVDLENRTICVNDTKNDVQRLAVINESLLAVLTSYLDFKKSIPLNHIHSPSTNFFITQHGKPCDYKILSSWFQKILHYGGIPKHSSVNRPRIHDIRHTAAVHAFDKLIGNNIDVYVALPIVSAFLGHKNISSTECYIRMTHEAFPDFLEKSAFTEYVFPIKNNKDDDDDNGFC